MSRLLFINSFDVSQNLNWTDVRNLKCFRNYEKNVNFFPLSYSDVLMNCHQPRNIPFIMHIFYIFSKKNNFKYLNINKREKVEFYESWVKLSSVHFKVNSDQKLIILSLNIYRMSNKIRFA